MLKFQKRAARIILDKDFDAPSEPLFTELRWMHFKDRIEYRKALTIYKTLNEHSPSYMHDLFKNQNSSHAFTLRSHSEHHLHTPKPNLELFRKSLSYSGPQIWNKIPLHIRNSSSLHSFKTTYLQWRFSGGNSQI